MRRPPDVRHAGLFLILLLGASGCTGLSQRTNGSSPWPPGSDGETASPPGLFSWWHRSPSRVDAAPADSTRLAETARPSQGDADASRTATSPWPETQSEWIARTFPRFNRLFNGTPAAKPAGGPDANGVLWTNRTRDDSPAADAEVTASAPRSDGAVRPTEGDSPIQTASKPGRSGVQPPYFDNLPFSPTPPSVKSPRQSTPEPSSEPASDTSEPASALRNPTDASKTDGARSASFEPDDDSASANQKTPPATEAGSVVNQTPSEPNLQQEILPAPALAGPQESPAAGRNTGPVMNAPESSTDTPELTPDTGVLPGPDSRLAQVPPPPPATQRTPPAPAPSGGDRPATSPPSPPAAASPGADKPTTTNPAPPSATTAAPPAPTAAQEAAQPAPTAAQEAAQPAPTTPQAAVQPAPTTSQAAAPPVVSVQRPFAASGQSIYAPPPPMAQPQPQHHLLGWLFHDEDAAPHASSQLPVAAFPATYSSPQNVPPTGQGNAAGCETAAKAPKKPCFLKVWIHDLKHGHGTDASDCGHGGVCASAQGNAAACDSGAKAPKKPCFLKVWIHDLKNGHGPDASECGHGGACASAQGNAAACETAVKAPKKPCFLKVWIHDLKNGHGSGCGNCQNGGGSCCQSCKCCTGGTPGPASAQGGIASPQAAPAQIVARP